MARAKAYNESDVIEKATQLFWKDGYEMTSMRSLEQAMGINKFSIYASFGSKQGVFVASLRCYKTKLNRLVDKLRDSKEGVAAIKIFFYDFLDFSKEGELNKGCLFTSTSNEIGLHGEAEISHEINDFVRLLRAIFMEKLRIDGATDEDLIQRQANYLLIAKQALSNASKVYEKNVLVDYVEMTFEKL